MRYNCTNNERTMKYNHYITIISCIINNYVQHDNKMLHNCIFFTHIHKPYVTCIDKNCNSM